VPYRLVTVDSAVGPWSIEGDDDAVTRVFMPHEPRRDHEARPGGMLLDVARQLEEYFAGTRRAFDVAFAPVAATTFQRDAWAATSAIPYGHVRTYAEVALAAGYPRAHRAVGNANHANPWPILVPCHRVVGASGLGGYGGGAEVKRFLLRLEGLDY
jgi:methylated-DNA-[protein]-cysteine S-methyltransferase